MGSPETGPKQTMLELQKEQLGQELESLDAEISAELEDLRSMIDAGKTIDASNTGQDGAAKIFEHFNKSSELVDQVEEAHAMPTDANGSIFGLVGSNFIQDAGLRQRFESIDLEEFLSSYEGDSEKMKSDPLIKDFKEYMDNGGGQAHMDEYIQKLRDNQKPLEREQFEGMLKGNNLVADADMGEALDAFGYGAEDETSSPEQFKQLVAKQLVLRAENDGEMDLSDLAENPENADKAELMAQYLSNNQGEIARQAIAAERLQEKAEVASRKDTVASVLEEYPEITTQIADMPQEQRGAYVRAQLTDKYQQIVFNGSINFEQKVGEDRVTLQKSEAQNFMDAVGMDDPSLFPTEHGASSQGEVPLPPHLEQRMIQIEQEFNTKSTEVLAERDKYDFRDIEVAKAVDGNFELKPGPNADPQSILKMTEMINSIPEDYWGGDFANAYVKAIEKGGGNMLKDFKTWKVEDARDETFMEELVRAIRYLMKKFENFTDSFSGKKKEKPQNPHLSPELREFTSRPEAEQNRVIALRNRTLALNGEAVQSEPAAKVESPAETTTQAPATSAPTNEQVQQVADEAAKTGDEPTPESVVSQATPKADTPEPTTPQPDTQAPEKAPEVATGKKIDIQEVNQIMRMSNADMSRWDGLLNLAEGKESKTEGVKEGYTDRMVGYMNEGLTPEDILGLQDMETNDKLESVTAVPETGTPTGYTYKFEGEEPITVQLKELDAGRVGDYVQSLLDTPTTAENIENLVKDLDGLPDNLGYLKQKLNPDTILVEGNQVKLKELNHSITQDDGKFRIDTAAGLESFDSFKEAALAALIVNYADTHASENPDFQVDTDGNIIDNNKNKPDSNPPTKQVLVNASYKSFYQQTNGWKDSYIIDNILKPHFESKTA